LKVVKLCCYWELPIDSFRHSCCGIYRLGTMHSVTDRQTDIWTHDSIMPILAKK